MALFPSAEWLDEYVEQIKESESWSVAAATWEGDLSYVIEAEPDKGLAQDMYQALWSGLICAAVTVLVSLVTTPKPESDLEGLVYGCTKIPHEEDHGLLGRPAFWAVLATGAYLVLQWIFW